MIDRIQFSTGVAVGGDGVATATGQSGHVRGKVQKVHVAYLDSPPATTDITLSDEGDPGSEAIVSLVNGNTDITIYPRRITEKSDGTDVLYAVGEEVHDPFVVYGRLEAVIAQANAGDSCTVTVWVEV